MAEGRRTPGSDEIQSIVDLVDSLDRLRFKIDGTKGQPGLLDRTEKMVERIGTAGDNISVYVDRLAAADQLHEQLKALPSQLLRPHESQAFRESMQRALYEDATHILRASYEAAMTSGCLEAVETAVTEIQARVDTAALERSYAAREASHALQSKLDSANEEITKLKTELNAAHKQISGHSTSLNNLRDVLNSRFIEQLATARKWNLAIATGAILGGILSNLYLTPKIEAFLTSEVIDKPIHYARK
ncbi:hypothetical protein LRS11_02955 [Pseudomonas sp. J452]|uniref:hypothetical protein n=1 Tax=Pseudomonas sp. J452 TaxID=2898441 RepID=UPI0021AE22D2|nr:hypothetical protein [Pseudomonas sp. J452]UUY09008.1 hypothetical protein LRS11_02955 [Pseudomonas sp. J452]